jgi:hypothetical protein
VRASLRGSEKPETGVARRALGEHGGQDAGPLIEVVVDFGRGLVLMRAQDPAHVLGQAALIGDRRGEEQGIQGRAVEAFATPRIISADNSAVC